MTKPQKPYEIKVDITGVSAVTTLQDIMLGKNVPILWTYAKPLDPGLGEIKT